MQTITFLEAFNAKTMTTRRIAESFVPSEKFRSLAGPWNSLLLGPRGSGKTTLLRMLQLSALREWEHAEAAEYREKIGYTGIFVPADIAWNEMIEGLKACSFSDEAGSALAQCVYCTHVLLATVDAMESRISDTVGAKAHDYRRAKIDQGELNAALSDICGFWKLLPTLLSFSGVRSSLQQRLIDTQDISRRLALMSDPSMEDLRERLPFIYLEVNTVAESALDRFDRAIGDPGAKWALLFDEFEIAPAEIQISVFRRLRSANKKLIYKVGLAPCTPHTLNTLQTTAPTSEDNDFKRTLLWYTDKDSGLAFSEQLFRARLAGSAQYKGRSPTEVLGQTAYLSEDGVKTVYGQGEEWGKVFQSLASKDSSFAQFLVSKGIDPNKLETSPDTDTGNTVRKIAPLVAFRDAYRREGGGGNRGRKRLVFAYSGRDAVFAICEGNPRWLIGVINMMLGSAPPNASRITGSVQIEAILKAAEAFAAMLSTVATHQPIGLKTNQPIDRVLRQIGDYFFRRVVRDTYVEEPPLSFEVDMRVPEEMENALRIAFNHGAIVNIPSKEAPGNDFETLKGKRFRLAYLLAPTFKLPLRATKQVALSSILSSEPNSVSSSMLRAIPTQVSLFPTDDA
jgi:energy-coupling factor transporter ATP-binding protein EcfA2